ncbi:MAG: DUF1761 domain-containing protein [Saprospiraceae bacterium]|nr:DUF1761 domain-containing protein [Saprospiraceae bacterium]
MAINFLALLVAALVPMVLGFVWYHPKVFGTAWMAAAGMTEEKIKGSNMALIFGLSFLFALMLAFVMHGLATHDAYVEGATYYAEGGAQNPDPNSEVGKWMAFYKENLADSHYNFKHGLVHGAMLFGLMLVLPVFATNALFERKGFKYVAINAGYWMVCLGLMSGILAAWR